MLSTIMEVMPFASKVSFAAGFKCKCRRARSSRGCCGCKDFRTKPCALLRRASEKRPVTIIPCVTLSSLRHARLSCCWGNWLQRRNTLECCAIIREDMALCDGLVHVHDNVILIL